MEEISVLLIEPQATTRQYLSEQLMRAFAKLDLTKSEDVLSSISELKKTRFDLCVVGSGLEESQQLQLLEAQKEHQSIHACAMVAVVQATDNETLLSYVRAGAHGLLLPPISSESLAEVVNTALAAAKRDSQTPKEAKEHLNSLPWILETFANRLESIASRLKTAEQGGNVVEASPKSIKEALLSTIAASGEKDETAVENVLRVLLKNQSSSKQ